MSRRFVPRQATGAALSGLSSLPVETTVAPGTTCMYRGGGCLEPAMPDRWVCATHAARLEALGERHRAGQLRPTAQDMAAKARRRGRSEREQ